MKQTDEHPHQFTVRINCKESAFVLICIAVLEVIFVGAAFYSNTILPKVMAVLWGVFGIILFTASFLFCVKVNGSEFHVRTKMGRRYQFLCSEISKVSCVKKQSVRFGPMFYMEIVSNGEKLQLNHGMTGFMQTAKYLLEQRDARAIKKSAINPQTVTMLRRYASGEIYGKNKTERVHAKAAVKRARPLADFNTMEQAQWLFESSGCWGTENCCFVTYENAHVKYLPTTAITDDPYNGYLINKTERGFGMFPLAYQKKSLRANPTVMAVMEKDHFFIPNEKVKAVSIRAFHPRVGGETAGIALDLWDRKLYLIAKREEPLIPYHNDNLAAFVKQYQKKQTMP